MDMGSLLKMGASAFINSKLSGDSGSGLDSNILSGALSKLTGDSEEGGLDIGSLVEKMQGGGMGDIAASFLGDGDNAEMSDSNITDLFGSEKISNFANELGVSEEEAVGGLRESLPEMMNQASSGGSLLDSIGGISGAIGLAGKLFGK